MLKSMCNAIPCLHYSHMHRAAVFNRIRPRPQARAFVTINLKRRQHLKSPGYAHPFTAAEFVCDEKWHGHQHGYHPFHTGSSSTPCSYRWRITEHIESHFKIASHPCCIHTFNFNCSASSAYWFVYSIIVPVWLLTPSVTIMFTIDELFYRKYIALLVVSIDVAMVRIGMKFEWTQRRRLEPEQKKY